MTIYEISVFLIILKANKFLNLFSDNSRKYYWKKLYFSKTMKNQFFLILFEISVMEKFFPSQIFQKV